MRGLRYILLIGLMFGVLNLAAQSGLHFPEPEWNFGSVAEEAGPIGHRFAAKNTGAYPEVILDVTSSCGCTKPEFSRKPVLPGRETDVTVTFNPAGQSGTVDRMLVVYGDGQQVLARLRIRGEVVPRRRSVEERFPVEAGGGIRLTANFVPFDLLPQGETVQTRIGVANTSQERRRIRFAGVETSGFLTLDAPEVLEPGEEAQLLVSYRIPANSRVYGSISDRYVLEVDGRRQRLSFRVRGTAVDARSDAERTPAARLSPGIVRFGDVPRNERRSGYFRLENEGSAALTVRAVELPEGIGCSLKAGDRVPAKEGVPVSVSVDSDRFGLGAMSERIRIVTDDPKKPVMQLRVAAMIVEP